MRQHYPSLNHLLTAFTVILTAEIVTVIFFVLSKKILSVPFNYFQPLSTLAFHSSFFIPLFMLSSFFVFLYYAAFPLWLSRNSFSVRFHTATVWVLYLLTFLPLGNFIKHQSFFFEYWMWLCAFWFHTVLLTVIAWCMMGIKKTKKNNSNHSFPQKYFRILTSECHHPVDVWMLVGSFLFVVGVSYFLGQKILGGVPHVQDSIAQFFQAKIFSHGKIFFPIPENADFFERIYVVMKDERWYSIYPPGYALLLSAGIILHIPQWINPVVSGIILLVTFEFSRKFISYSTARLTVILMCVSPFFIFMAAGWMNHPTALLFLLLYMYFLLRSQEQKGRVNFFWLCLAGFFYGWAFITRPMTALAFLLFGWMWIISTHRLSRKAAFKSFLNFILGTLPFAVFYLIFNSHTTGAPFLTGYVDFFGGNPLGFGLQPWGAEPLGPKIPNEVLHTPWRGAANILCNLNGMNYFLFGFPIPSLSFAFLLFLPGMKRYRSDWLCGASVLCVSMVYFFYFFQDYCYGPRFLYETIPFMAILSARGILEWYRRMPQVLPVSSNTSATIVFGFVTLCILFSLAVVWTERSVSMSHGYWSTRDEIVGLAKKNISEKDALLFVEFEENYAALYSLMDPKLDSGWIIAHDLGKDKNQILIESYPGWKVYSVHLQDTDDPFAVETVVEPYGSG